MKTILNFFYGLLFVGLVLATPAAMYLVHPAIFYFYLFNLVGAALYFSKLFKNPLTKWCAANMLSIDQTWQVHLSPILNIGVRTKHKFGAPDETASSVVGKNLEATNELRWKLIEWFLATFLEGGKPHAIKAIEWDEGF